MAKSAVRFIESGSGILSLLEIESEHCADPVTAIRGLLFELRVQIVGAETHNDERGVRSLLQLVEFDGARIEHLRRREIQASIRAVLQQPRRLRLARPRVISRALLNAVAAAETSLPGPRSRDLPSSARR